MGSGDTGLFSFNDLLSLEVFLILGFGLVATISVALRPRLFWPILIVAVMAGILPKTRGLGVADEILLAAVVVGGLMAVAVRPGIGGRGNGNGLHRVVFFLWMVYLILQSVRGGWVTGEFRIVVGWSFLYGSLIVALYLMSRPDFRVSSVRNLSIIALVSTLAVFSVYLAQGLYFDQVLGPGGRWLSQNQFVSGSAFAVFPIMVGLPVAIFLVRDPSRKVRLLAWANLILIVVVGVFFDSRVTLFVIAAFLPIFVFRLGTLRIVALVVVFSVSSTFLWSQAMRFVPSDFSDLYDSASTLGDPDSNDISRVMLLKAGFMTINDSPGILLFGGGVNSHKYLSGPAMEDLFDQYRPGKTAIQGQFYRTTAFSALLIDTGLIGILFLGANLIFVARMLLISKSPRRFVLLMILPVLGMWLMINNIQGMVLLYLLIMPHGLIEQLNRRETVTEPVRDETRSRPYYSLGSTI